MNENGPTKSLEGEAIPVSSRQDLIQANKDIITVHDGKDGKLYANRTEGFAPAISNSELAQINANAELIRNSQEDYKAHKAEQAKKVEKAEKKATRIERLKRWGKRTVASVILAASLFTLSGAVRADSGTRGDNEPAPAGSSATDIAEIPADTDYILAANGEISYDQSEVEESSELVIADTDYRNRFLNAEGNDINPDKESRYSVGMPFPEELIENNDTEGALQLIFENFCAQPETMGGFAYAITKGDVDSEETAEYLELLGAEGTTALEMEESIMESDSSVNQAKEGLREILQNEIDYNNNGGIEFVEGEGNGYSFYLYPETDEITNNSDNIRLARSQVKDYTGDDMVLLHLKNGADVYARLLCSSGNQVVVFVESGDTITPDFDPGVPVINEDEPKLPPAPENPPAPQEKAPETDIDIAPSNSVRTEGENVSVETSPPNQPPAEIATPNIVQETPPAQSQTPPPAETAQQVGNTVTVETAPSQTETITVTPPVVEGTASGEVSE